MNVTAIPMATTLRGARFPASSISSRLSKVPVSFPTAKETAPILAIDSNDGETEAPAMISSIRSETRPVDIVRLSNDALHTASVPTATLIYELRMELPPGLDLASSGRLTRTKLPIFEGWSYYGFANERAGYRPLAHWTDAALPSGIRLILAAHDLAYPRDSIDDIAQALQRLLGSLDSTLPGKELTADTARIWNRAWSKARSRFRLERRISKAV